MKNIHINILILVCLVSFSTCSQSKKTNASLQEEKPMVKEMASKQAPHQYGGWYCPDNLRGFPAVDITNWKSVPVVNGRMATKEETQNGTSLIFVDTEKYPDTKPLDMKIPKLARYYSENSKKEEIIIVIQALQISNDSIIGFRYLNGGNGSARFNEVKMLSDNEIEKLKPSHFVTLTININATQDKIWFILTKPEYCQTFQSIFDKENKLKSEWRKSSKINFKYADSGKMTSEYFGELFGNYYVQIDCESDTRQYVEKFLLLEDKEAKTTKLQIVCGPYFDDFEKQKSIIITWAQKLKVLSEF